MRRDLSPTDINKALGDHAGIIWIDLDTTCRAHIAILEHVCKFHPLTIEDTLNPNSRVKLDEYPDYLFLIIRGVRFYETTDDPYDLETFNLNFYLGRRFLVTVHAGPSAAVDAVAEKVERTPELMSPSPRPCGWCGRPRATTGGARAPRRGPQHRPARR